MKKMKKLIIIIVILTSTTTIFAQSAKEKMPASKSDTSGKILYTCPMHPEVLSDKPGKCPKCGMDLVKKKVDKIYTCSMHPDVVSDKPGKCPKCGMDLVEKKSTDKMKMQ
jgi:transcription initiation factor IIE alpha subunit